MRYERIVFLQGHEATEALQVLEKKGELAAINCLADWHDMGNHETAIRPSYGTCDKVLRIEGYILSYNTRIGYIGLEFDLDHVPDSQPRPWKGVNGFNERYTIQL